DVLVLYGDQIYRMDFQKLIHSHRERGADVTLAVTAVPRARTSTLGILKVDDNQRVRQLTEKPQSEDDLARLRTPAGWLEQRGLNPQGREYLANMGIYLFRCAALIRLLAAHPTAKDLVHDVLMPTLLTQQVGTHLF